MSTETGPDRPPQRTVAELLAAHGVGQPTSSRRRSRRDPADAAGEPPAPEGRPGTPQQQAGAAAWSSPANPAGPGAAQPAQQPFPPPGAAQQPEPWNPQGRREAPESSGSWRLPDPQSAPPRQPDVGWGPPPPDRRWAADPAVAEPTAREPRLRSSAPPAQAPQRPSRREVREAREAGLGQLSPPADPAGQAPAMPPHSPAQSAGRQPGPSFVENPTDELPRVAEPNGTSGTNGSRSSNGSRASRHHAAPAPVIDDRPAAPPRRSRAVHDAGPATGAMSPEELLDDDDQPAEDVKILGRSMTDLERVPEADTTEDDSDEGPEPSQSRMSRRSERRSPKRRFRLGGKTKADAEETVLTAARPPSINPDPAGDQASAESWAAARSQAPIQAPPQVPIQAPDLATDLATDLAADLDYDERGPIVMAPPLGGQPPAGLRRRPIGSHGLPDDVPAGLQDKAEVEAAPAASATTATPTNPAKAWLVVIAQLVGGAVAGAALWVAFRYLWGKMPPVALGAAVLATAGSVLVVRAIRRSDDLRTSLFAVLVGLVVTVSPAVLVLVSR